MTLSDHLLYALLWLSFGLGHSILAGATTRRGLGRVFGRWHRIAYNLIALTHVVAIYLIGRALLAKTSVAWALPQSLEWLLNAMAALGLIVLVAATGGYRLATFAGWGQLAGDEEDRGEGLRVAGLNRAMRHPLYTGALMVLWSGARSDFGLATALWGTLYIMIGSRFEERRLLERFGAEYSSYRSRVPALIPWRGLLRKSQKPAD